MSREVMIRLTELLQQVMEQPPDSRLAVSWRVAEGLLAWMRETIANVERQGVPQTTREWWENVQARAWVERVASELRLEIIGPSCSDPADADEDSQSRDRHSSH